MPDIFPASFGALARNKAQNTQRFGLFQLALPLFIVVEIPELKVAGTVSQCGIEHCLLGCTIQHRSN